MITQDLDAGLALCDAATPGEWTYSWCKGKYDDETREEESAWCIESPCDYIATTALREDSSEDAAFICWANPTRIRELINEVKRLREKYERRP